MEMRSPFGQELPWTRFWSPVESESFVEKTDGFFPDPHSAFEKHLNPQAATLSEIIPKIGLLVLRGEPGLGKSNELQKLRELLLSNPDDTPQLFLSVRKFESFLHLEAHLEKQAEWASWNSEKTSLDLVLDGIDEGLIRIPYLISNLTDVLANSPVERLRLIVACRSAEWPEEEGKSLASLWPSESVRAHQYRLEPLRSEDAKIAVESRGKDGHAFLQEVHRADVSSLASRPITLAFLIGEFQAGKFTCSSFRELYERGCRRMCEESNADRADLERRLGLQLPSPDEKLSAAKRIAAVYLLGGRSIALFTSASFETPDTATIHLPKEISGTASLSDSAIRDSLETPIFIPLGSNRFTFAHQTFAECLAGRELASLGLAQLRTLLLSRDIRGEHVIPQLAELASWVAGYNAMFFDHVANLDPGSLLRSDISPAGAESKRSLVKAMVELAGRDDFFDESGFWRYLRGLDHPTLPDQLAPVIADPTAPFMARRVALAIAEECDREELVPALRTVLDDHQANRSLRDRAARALCSSMPDTRLFELEPLARGEVGPDPNQTILGEALKRLVPTYWNVADVLPLLGRTANPSFFGSYWRAVEYHLPEHLTDEDLLAGLLALKQWNGAFSQSSFRKNLALAILRKSLSKIDDPPIRSELVELWLNKASNFREFFREAQEATDDAAPFGTNELRRWAEAVIEHPTKPDARELDHIACGTCQLLFPADLSWLLEKLTTAEAEHTAAWARLVAPMVVEENARLENWDQFIATYQTSPDLQNCLPWFEQTEINTPERRRERVQWLWRQRRQKRFQKRRRGPDAEKEIQKAFDLVESGNTWAFKNLCWALAIKQGEGNPNHLRHDLTTSPGWASLDQSRQKDARDAARKFLLDHSDGFEVMSAETNFSRPGVVAVWFLRDEITHDTSLQEAVAARWLECILSTYDTENEPARELFTLAYRIAPEETVRRWMRQVQTETAQHHHPNAMRRAKGNFDERLASEVVEFILALRNGKSIRHCLEVLDDLSPETARGLASYLIQKFNSRQGLESGRLEGAIIGGLHTGSRAAWLASFSILFSNLRLAKRVLLAVSGEMEFRGGTTCAELKEDEIADLYLLLCRVFPQSEDPPETSDSVSPRKAASYFRNGVLSSLSARSTTAACDQLLRLAQALPEHATWLRWRYHETLKSVRRNEWQPLPDSEIIAILDHGSKRLVRNQDDLLDLVTEALGTLQKHLTQTDLPAVDELWHWQGSNQKRTGFRHKDEDAVSGYIARWIRDRIGPKAGVVVNREVQLDAKRRPDILVQAWSLTESGRNRTERPITVTIEVKGCWNDEIKTGAKKQLAEKYLGEGRTHGIFLVAWFYSPKLRGIDPKDSSLLKHDAVSDAEASLAGFVNQADLANYRILPFLLDCRLS